MAVLQNWSHLNRRHIKQGFSGGEIDELIVCCQYVRKCVKYKVVIKELIGLLLIVL